MTGRCDYNPLDLVEIPKNISIHGATDQGIGGGGQRTYLEGGFAPETGYLLVDGAKEERRVLIEDGLRGLASEDDGEGLPGGDLSALLELFHLLRLLLLLGLLLVLPLPAPFSLLKEEGDEERPAAHDMELGEAAHEERPAAGTGGGGDWGRESRGDWRLGFLTAGRPHGRRLGEKGRRGGEHRRGGTARRQRAEAVGGRCEDIFPRLPRRRAERASGPVDKILGRAGGPRALARTDGRDAPSDSIRRSKA